jgi:hypothetical protein
VFDPQLQSRWPLALATAAMLASCGGGGSSSDSAAPAPSPSALTRPVDLSDSEIATLIYSGARTPQDFYREENATGHANIAKTHIKNTDVDASVAAAEAQFELCTNDWNEALAWSEATAQNAPQYSQLIATNDDARYFEFGRLRAGSPELYVQARVYKCAYLDRSSANLRASGGSAGHLNVRPLDATELKRVSEYLWQFTAYNNFGYAVLDSASTNANEHTLYIGKLVREGVSASCDRIDVIAWRHNVDPSTGSASLNVQSLWSFGAHESSGIAQLCAE